MLKYSHGVATPALLCHKEPDQGMQSPRHGIYFLPWLVLYGISVPLKDPFRAWKPPIPYVIKNQRGARLGFGCEELVLYGIRELA